MNPCDNCFYYGRYYSQGVRMCLYLFMTNQKRPCPPVAECTVKVGSDGSAASGGRSDRSEWQRSADGKVLGTVGRCRAPQQEG